MTIDTENNTDSSLEQDSEVINVLANTRQSSLISEENTRSCVEELPEPKKSPHDEIHQKWQTFLPTILNNIPFLLKDLSRNWNVSTNPGKTQPNTNNFRYLLALGRKQVKEHISTEVQKLEEKLSSVKEQLTSLQGQNEQIVNRMGEISETNKKHNLEFVEEFKTQLVKAIWEHVFITEEYNGRVIEEVAFSEEGFEELKKTCRDSSERLKAVLERHLDTVCFHDKDGSSIDKQRHYVVHWLTTDQQEQRETIAQTLRSGVEDINGKIIYKQQVSAYYYKTPAEQPKQSHDEDTLNPISESP